LGRPSLQRGRGDPEVGRDLFLRRVTTTRDNNDITLELGRVLARHNDILP
jgi:CRISPR/Cas system-associated exonuclease Cas4 (RecB family)